MTKPSVPEANVVLCYQFQSDYYDAKRLRITVEDAVKNADEQVPQFPVKFRRLDKNPTQDVITETIRKEIDKAIIVIVEISDQNKNVMIELGLALGAHKKIIAIREESSQNVEMPSNIHGYRYLVYKRDELDRLKIKITDALVETLTKQRVEDLFNSPAKLDDFLRYYVVPINEPGKFSQVVREKVMICKSSFYYLGTSGMALTEDDWVTVCRDYFLSLHSCHRIVHLLTLKEVYNLTRDEERTVDYCIWLARYYPLIRDGVFCLYNSPEVGFSHAGLSMFVFDRKEVLISFGKPNKSLNQKGFLLVDRPGVASMAHEYARGLISSAKEVTAKGMGKYFMLNNKDSSIPETIAQAIDNDSIELESVCRDYVFSQIETL